MQNDQRAAHILDTARPVFVRYGFRKTSMTDIARAAGISRASLYLIFNSKEELFRAGSARAHARTMVEVETALAGQGGVFSRMEMAIAAFQRGLIAPFGGSADAKELFDANMALAKDITLDARTKLLSLLSRTLADSATQREIDLDAVKAHPVDLARIIVAAMDGIKDAQGASSNLENGTKLLMRLLQAAMTPRAA